MGSHTVDPALAVRNKAMRAACEAGETAESVGRRYGLARRTVENIVIGVRRAVGETGTFPGSHRPHPTTGDPGYSRAESEFLAACEAFRQSSGRPFLLACDYLHVLTRLGYSRGGSA